MEDELSVWDSKLIIMCVYTHTHTHTHTYRHEEHRKKRQKTKKLYIQGGQGLTSLTS